MIILLKLVPLKNSKQRDFFDKNFLEFLNIILKNDQKHCVLLNDEYSLKFNRFLKQNLKNFEKNQNNELNKVY
jgi:hypothetical protein